MKEQYIDFVVTWLDPNDPEWQKSYAKYSPSSKGDMSKARFRDMKIFRYWFRAVEQYAPWVRKVFLITNGKFPDWINKECQKLELVKHEDYMPQSCLPTFNSCAIELHMHKIKGLSEHFVYFNDDMILNAPVEPDYYFKNGLPCDMNKETCYNVPIYTEKDRFGIYMSMMANIGIINRHFRRWDTVRQSPRRWFGPHLGLRGLLMSGMLSRQRLFVGFSNYHTEQAFLKTIFDEVWEKEPDFMSASCSRFREEVIANPYIFRYWQLASNRFYPQKKDSHFFFLTERGAMDQIERTILQSEGTSICLNDTSLCSDSDYEYIKDRLQHILDKKYPKQSSFELPRH
ncbi:MAG: Stealth CR1 domain-containing protein [Prevotella sp.]|nr:Stealth CR1 domain-containing protein [Prevotella sp.]